LRNIIEYLDIFDGDLEGALRVDANISIMGGQRAEIKNISSHKGAERALLFEIVRQKNVLRRGGVVVQETRHFDEARRSQFPCEVRKRHMITAIFPSLILCPQDIRMGACDKATLPELPDARRMRFVEQYGIMDDHAKSLTSELKLAVFYEDVAKIADPKTAAVWICDVLKGELNYRDLTIDAFRKEHMLSVIELLASKKNYRRWAVDIIRTLLDKAALLKRSLRKSLLKVEGISWRRLRKKPSRKIRRLLLISNPGRKRRSTRLWRCNEKNEGEGDARTAREMLLGKLR